MKTPLLNDAIAGYKFQESEPFETTIADRKELEASCIDLICKLENVMAKAKAMSHVNFVDESSEIGRQMLGFLSDFTGKSLKGKAAEQATEEIERGMAVSRQFDEALKTRPISNTIMRTFFKADEVSAVQESHLSMGDALVKSCAATLYHGIMMIGMESEVGREIDQSTVVFVEELQEFWS